MRNYSLFFAFVLAVLIGANILFIKSTIFAGVLGLGYIFVVSLGWSKVFNTTHKSTSYIYGGLFATTLLSLIGAVVYKLYNLNDIVVIAVLALVLIAPAFIRNYPTETDALKKEVNKYSYLFLVLPILFSVCLTLILANSAVTESIRSPWEIVPTYFWYVLFIFWLSWIVAIINTAKNNFSHFLTFLLTLALYNIYNVAVIVYQIGFGFDPFIHQATEKLIASEGVVYPKPWYYLGQYSLVVLIHKLTFLPIVLVDKWLVLVLTVVALPVVTVNALKNFFDNSRATYLTLASLVLIPASFLIFTTPQALANLILIIIVLLTLTYNLPVYFLAILALTATLIHPIAGIPAMVIVFIYFLQKHVPKFSVPLTVLVTILSIPVIPILFWWQNSQHNFNVTNFALPSFNGDQNWIYFQNRYDFIFDTVYHWHWNGFILLTILIAIGTFIAFKQAKFKLLPHFALLVFLIANWLLLSKYIPFNFLINYEQAQFADRFLDLAIIAGLPFIALGLFSFYKKVTALNSSPVYQFMALTFALLATITVYTIYPRVDAYETSRGYSTSQADIEAVKLIHQDSNSENYVVLANQSVSASALRELGFSKYYERQDNKTGEQIFFYPIPTGGSLYQIYLEMVYSTPTREVVEKAMLLTGVDTVYFVLNDYWFNSEKLNEIALTEANESFKIETEVSIYKFTNSNIIK